MKKINTNQFRRATREMPREVNRQIVLNLVREHQPISRAQLARKMGVGRGVISILVAELIGSGAIYEGEVGEAQRGRKPTLLYVRSDDRFVIAIDVRFSRTHLVLSDFAGREIARDEFDTPYSPAELVEELGRRVRRLLRTSGVENCEGIGLVVPGRVDRRTGRVLSSPQLGWQDVDLREALGAATGLHVYIENGPNACALAQIWMAPRGSGRADNFVYVRVSDGVGAGVVINGEVVRGHTDTAGEFGHIPLNPEGPLCLCGRRGCWEAYTSSLATLARYLGLDISLPETRERLRTSKVSVAEVVERARAGDEAALRALQETGHYLGMGLGAIINALNPAQIIIGGDITAGWDLIEPTVHAAARERVLMARAAATPIIPEPANEHARLRGAAALVIAPNYAAPRVA